MVHMSNHVASEWTRFCYVMVGRELPMTALEQEHELLIVGHEVGEAEPAITCKNGQVVRRLALSFNVESKEILWS